MSASISQNSDNAKIADGMATKTSREAVEGDGAVGQLSKATQQNASVSEELAATSAERSGHAEQLQQSVAFFKTAQDTRRMASRARSPALERRATAPRLMVPPARTGSGNFKPY